MHRIQQSSYKTKMHTSSRASMLLLLLLSLSSLLLLLRAPGMSMGSDCTEETLEFCLFKRVMDLGLRSTVCEEMEKNRFFCCRRSIAQK